MELAAQRLKPPMLENSIGDDELLYRCVVPGGGRVEWSDGEVKASTQAFFDRSYRISVDRAHLCGNNPAHTQVEPGDHVCRLRAGDVRRINTVQSFEPDGKTVARNYDVRVEPDPVAEDHARNQKANPAHAVIFAHPHPEVGLKSVFRRLREALAQLAVWEEGFAPAAPN